MNIGIIFLIVYFLRLLYRIMLRSREKSRENFIQMRKHVMIKIEMLDEKHGKLVWIY